MNANKIHNLLLAGLLCFAAFYLVVLPILKVIFYGWRH